MKNSEHYIFKKYKETLKGGEKTACHRKLRTHGKHKDKFPEFYILPHIHQAYN